MAMGQIRYGNTLVGAREGRTRGNYMTVAGESYHVIEEYDRMQPFLFTLAGDGDHWMFLSSRGGLTCGRKSPDHALFPYYTDDKIHDAADTTGPYTVIFVKEGDYEYYWKPFLDTGPEVYDIARYLRKNGTGNRIVYEEENRSLELCFSYSWELSSRFGFVRTSFLINRGSRRRIRVLDGLRNILPAGADRLGQERSSTLIDGYKQAYLDRSLGLGIFTLGSIVTDRAEPSEALRATTVFQIGFSEAEILLSEGQITSFERGGTVHSEATMRGRRGAYLLCGNLDLEAGEKKTWTITADVERDASDIEALRAFRRNETDILQEIKEDIKKGRERLKNLAGRADGFQLGSDSAVTDRHYSNTLFNIMRGGVFPSGYEIERDNFVHFLGEWNREVAAAQNGFLKELPERIDLGVLRNTIETEGDEDLLRLSLEYLPLTFSRRHGDPSRPWNTFEIDVWSSEDSPKIAYQGNWRDIFQNWEALALSYPLFVDGMIAKFLNAGTADGYNPYRISHRGIDWEVLDPEDPWSNIGYWGDHQIVYLLRLMELSFRHDPERLRGWLDRELFTFADIPYRIRGFRKLLEDPHNSILYDSERDEKVRRQVERLGADGKLLQDGNRPLKANLLEKLLISLLTKLSNLVPDGGIWMNTQRPEWNDANNALAGWGLSVVTVAYLHRFILFLEELLPTQGSDILVKKGVLSFFREMYECFNGYDPDKVEERELQRMDLLERVGMAGERYREKVYDGSFFSSTSFLSVRDLRQFLTLARNITAETLRSNRRSDSLYHSYNIMVIEDGRILVEALEEMLEGQVAVLSSGLLSAKEQVELLDALERSRLYRDDQHSYMLYPDRSLPSFLEKNLIPEDRVKASEILDREAREGGGRILKKDIRGNYHFNGDFRNARYLLDFMNSLNSREGEAGRDVFSRKEKESLLELYEETFQHRRFTGRSGSFFKYEGLGSIYWHMVSKLLLAVLENFHSLDGAGTIRSGEYREKLKRHYRKIREGIGVHKSPQEYGAFPTDPYSHTPAFMGVQQPGMTGQVKEDILSRFLELGVLVEEACLKFRSPLIGREEFLAEAKDFSFIDVRGRNCSLRLAAGAMAFTFCNVPVIYYLNREARGELISGAEVRSFIPDEGLSREMSRDIFERTGKVERIEVGISGL